MAYLGANIYFYDSGTTYNKGDVVGYGTSANTTATGTVDSSTITVNSANNFAVGMTISALNGRGIQSSTTVTSINSTTIGLSRPLVSALSSTKVTATTYYVSLIDGNVGNTPSSSSAYWSTGSTAYTFVDITNSGSRTITTDFIKTDTHDKLNGTVFNYGVSTSSGNNAGTLYIQQSPDGKNWDYQSTVATANTSNSGVIDTPTGTVTGFSAKFTEEIVSPYIRLKFVLGGTTDVLWPTIFRLNARTSDAGVKY